MSATAIPYQRLTLSNWLTGTPLLSSRPYVSSSHTAPILALLEHSSLINHKWLPYRKKRVVMRVGYVGSDYKGLQLQRNDPSVSTVEKELENAIYKAGGILETNFGNLNRIGWNRSSRTDKGVHSLATTISLKMEIPDTAWKDDPHGIALANHINLHLPETIRIFSILPIQRRFDARRECDLRKYSYLLPAEIIGVGGHKSAAEIEDQLSDMNTILTMFEGAHPFHNFTVRSLYRQKRVNPTTELDPLISLSNKERSQELDGTDNPVYSEEEQNSSAINFSDEEAPAIDDFEPSSINQDNSAHLRARWLHEPSDRDRIGAAHFRKISRCSCGQLESRPGQEYIEISIWGESFMLHQIRKMVGTAVAVKRNVLPRDTVTLALSKFSRIVLPIAPSEVLILRGNSYSLREQSGMVMRSEMLKFNEAKEIAEAVDEFFVSVMLPRMSEFLNPTCPLWTNWVQKLDEYAGIPEVEMEGVRRSWRSWKENPPSWDRASSPH